MGLTVVSAGLEYYAWTQGKVSTPRAVLDGAVDIISLTGPGAAVAAVYYGWDLTHPGYVDNIADNSAAWLHKEFPSVIPTFARAKP